MEAHPHQDAKRKYSKKILIQWQCDAVTKEAEENPRTMCNWVQLQINRPNAYKSLLNTSIQNLIDLRSSHCLHPFFPFKKWRTKAFGQDQVKLYFHFYLNLDTFFLFAKHSFQIARSHWILAISNVIIFWHVCSLCIEMLTCNNGCAQTFAQSGYYTITGWIS